jgi:hypothetical protein
MAQNNCDSDELTRRQSAKKLEANNNTDDAENNVDEGEEGGQSGQKVLRNLICSFIYLFSPCFIICNVSGIINMVYYIEECNCVHFTSRNFPIQNRLPSLSETNSVKDFLTME